VVPTNLSDWIQGLVPEKLPISLFRIPGSCATVLDPVLWLEQLQLDAADPNHPRAKTGALQSDLASLYAIVNREDLKW